MANLILELALGLALVLACGAWPCWAAEGGAGEGQAKPIRALLVTGGCCHDYTRQKVILTQGITGRADVQWTVVHQGGASTDAKIPLYANPDWSKGYDVVVHNECFASVKDKAFVENILRPHREGLPAVLIHCAMHCYRTGTDQWFEFVGLRSPGHGPHYAYLVENVLKDHPIMKGFGDSWMTPKGELYDVAKLYPQAQVLAHAKRKSDQQAQAVVWTNTYGKGRVFGTTIGHYPEEMADPRYLTLVTRGLLWSLDRLDEKHLKPADAALDQRIQSYVAGPLPEGTQGSEPWPPAGQAEPDTKEQKNKGNKGNKDGNKQGKVAAITSLASGKAVKASSEETGKNNFAGHAVDGKMQTRWCANGPQVNEWLSVDLGSAQHVKSVRIHWEGQAAYRYRIEASADGQQWRTVVDRSTNEKVEQRPGHEFDAPGTRHLRVTYLGSSTGGWGSIWEFEAHAGPLPAIDEAVIKAADEPRLKAPEGFEVTMFGVPPVVNYPVCLAAAPTGEVFVGVDEQGSLGREKGRGKIIRCIDNDDDGKADAVNTFATVDHPRGLFFDRNRLWVLHPPHLTLYTDTDGDGKADREQRLLENISTDQNDKRGADHTTNGIRVAIDGWLYIAVGDYGFTDAKGTDGKVIRRRGGGVVRVRLDGTEPEIYAWGLRNILDVAIDPYLNAFTRDNTNDGGGWNVRLSHIVQSAQYGYPSHYINFHEETMPPLADLGGGSGCGGMFLNDARWPQGFNHGFYSCDWGRSFVFLHNLPAAGPSFTSHQQEFLAIPRPTDVDTDGAGRMYVASWHNGKFGYSGPDVGFVARVTPTDFKPQPFPRLESLSDAEVTLQLAGPSQVHRLHAQLELLRRGASAARIASVVALASNPAAGLEARVAAIFTLKQLAGVESHPALIRLAQTPELREFALRALTDRRSQLQGVPLDLIVSALSDANPRVRAQAVISLGRLGRVEAASALLSMTVRDPATPAPQAQPAHAQADLGRVIPHLAVRALVEIKAVDACLSSLQGPYRQGAMLALRDLHEDAAVDGLIRQLQNARSAGERRDALSLLIRLYHMEGEYKDGSWWSTRPDTSGPHYDRKTWARSAHIADAVKAAAQKADAELLVWIGVELARHKVKLEGLPLAPAAPAPGEPAATVAILPPAFDPKNKALIGNMNPNQAADKALKEAGDAARGAPLFTSQGCVGCHTTANGQPPKGPHLVDIGKRYPPRELLESILDPNAKIAQGFDSYEFAMADGERHVGFVVSESATEVELRNVAGQTRKLAKEDLIDRRKIAQSMMPQGLVSNLTPAQLADLLAYLQSLK